MNEPTPRPTVADKTATTSDAPELTLADRFRLAGRSTIEVDGRQVHSVFAIPVTGRSTLDIRRVRSGSARPQGLRLSAAVDLAVNGHRSHDLVLRSTTAPSRAEVLVEADEQTMVYVWNTWTVDGVEHAWLANAGMLVHTDLTTANPTVRLECSDGVGAPTFDDLVVSIEIVARVAAAATSAGFAPPTRLADQRS